MMPIIKILITALLINAIYHCKTHSENLPSHQNPSLPAEDNASKKDAESGGDSIHKNIPLPDASFAQYHTPTSGLQEVTAAIEPAIKEGVSKHIDEIRSLCANASFASDQQDLEVINLCKTLALRKNDEILHIFMSGAPMHLADTLQQLSYSTAASEEKSKDESTIYTLAPSIALITATLLGGYEAHAYLLLSKGAFAEKDSLKNFHTIGQRNSAITSLGVLYAGWSLFLMHDLVEHATQIIEHPHNQKTYEDLSATFFVATAVSVAVAAVSYSDEVYLKNYLSKLHPDIEAEFNRNEVRKGKWREELEQAILHTVGKQSKNIIMNTAKKGQSSNPFSQFIESKFSLELRNPDIRQQNLQQLKDEKVRKVLLEALERKHEGLTGEVKLGVAQLAFAVGLLIVPNVFFGLTPELSFKDRLTEHLNKITELVSGSEHFPKIN